MAHALLSPSAAHRWLNCPAAPRLEANVIDEGSSFAAEGSLAHAICAKKLKSYLGQSIKGEEKEIAELKDEYYCGEMEEYTDTYYTIVLEILNTARVTTPDAELLVETRLDFSDYVPDAFGTGDAVIIADGTMDIIDFKYGKGVKVSAYKNPQMMIYALGAYLKFSDEYNITRVRMSIIQPRIDNFSQSELSVTDLLTWAEKVLKPAAQLAYEGKGPQEPGEWCRFCKVKNSCRALANKCLKTVDAFADPKLLQPEELAEKVLPQIDLVKTWLSGIEDYALQQALSGVRFPGYKLVAGRSIRKITDAQGAAEELTKAGYAADNIYKPTELRTITDLERLVGKKQFAALCGDFITKPEGKPTLVPESDKRQAIDPVADDFKDINI